MTKNTVDWLLNAMKVTAGSRFNAAKRLERTDKSITWITAITSVYIIGLTILPYFWSLPKAVADNLNFVTVVLSIIILASSLIQSSRSDAVNAEQHHRSALEINEIIRELSIRKEEIRDVDLIDITKRYNSVLQKFSVNHSDLDTKRYHIGRPHEFHWVNIPFRIRIGVHLFLKDNIPIFVLGVISVGLCWMLISHVMPSRIINP